MGIYGGKWSYHLMGILGISGKRLFTESSDVWFYRGVVLPLTVRYQPSATRIQRDYDQTTTCRRSEMGTRELSLYVRPDPFCMADHRKGVSTGSGDPRQYNSPDLPPSHQSGKHCMFFRIYICRRAGWIFYLSGKFREIYIYLPIII